MFIPSVPAAPIRLLFYPVLFELTFIAMNILVSSPMISASVICFASMNYSQIFDLEQQKH